MGLLTFALNVTLDGCCDHREGVANDEMLRYWTRVMDAAGAMLFGRRTYELIEEAWPQVARDRKATPSNRDWAKKLEAKPKYVVSRWTRPNTIHLWAFDLLAFNGRDLRQQPLVKRQEGLEALLARFGCPAISLSAPFEDGLALLRVAEERGLEGGSEQAPRRALSLWRLPGLAQSQDLG